MAKKVVRFPIKSDKNQGSKAPKKKRKSKKKHIKSKTKKYQSVVIKNFDSINFRESR
jgi:hypothetical protein